MTFHMHIDKDIYSSILSKFLKHFYRVKHKFYTRGNMY